MPAFSRQSLLTDLWRVEHWAIPTRSIRLERDKTSFRMPLWKKTKQKTATEQAAADQLNADGYARLQEQRELAGLLGMPFTAE